MEKAGAHGHTVPGLRILVTAGPTREPIDPVRFISNRSTGKMGFAIAQVARSRGHHVCLVHGPVALPVPAGVDAIPVQTAAEMACAVKEHLSWCEVLIMAAAVADLRPRQVLTAKLKKERIPDALELERTEDILLALKAHKGGRFFVGFAAETDDLEAEARRKLVVKGLDLVVANDVSRHDAGFAVDTNEVMFVTCDGVDPQPLLHKDSVAALLIARIEAMRTDSADAG